MYCNYQDTLSVTWGGVGPPQEPPRAMVWNHLRWYHQDTFAPNSQCEAWSKSITVLENLIGSDPG